MSRHIVPVPAFKDNYIWVLRNGRHAAVVDPGEAAPVIEYLSAEGLEPVAVLITHHHPDHVGGLPALLERFRVPVIGPKNEPIERLTRRVSGGDRVDLPELGLAFEVIDVPGHTRAHIAYYGEKTLFCGDTLFACGCGRVFEGTPDQLYASLQKLAALPEDTLGYCAHEYTLANIRFARAVEPGNAALAERERHEAAVRASGRPTVPFGLAQEKATNPFLRCIEPEVIESANRHLGQPAARPAEVFAALRDWKNRF